MMSGGAKEYLDKALGAEKKVRLVSYHDPAFVKAVRHHVVDQGTSLTDWIDTAMRNQLEREQEQKDTPAPQRPF